MTMQVMGLTFRNPLGLAAGFDRSGEQAPALAALGFGHVEIGTITPGIAIAADYQSRQWRLGINIGSARPGLDSAVVEDYVAMLSYAYNSADYLCANLSSPFTGRNAETSGIDKLIGRMKWEIEIHAKKTGRCVPLLLKAEGGPYGSPIPKGLAAARHYGLDGLVLVSKCVKRIAEICRFLDGLTIISVGGVESVGDVKARLAAGASLVQLYSFFARHGTAGLRPLIEQLESV